jgi:hypothetical protein
MSHPCKHWCCQCFWFGYYSRSAVLPHYCFNLHSLMTCSWESSYASLPFVYLLQWRSSGLLTFFLCVVLGFELGLALDRQVLYHFHHAPSSLTIFKPGCSLSYCWVLKSSLCILDNSPLTDKSFENILFYSDLFSHCLNLILNWKFHYKLWVNFTIKTNRQTNKTLVTCSTRKS